MTALMRVRRRCFLDLPACRYVFLNCVHIADNDGAAEASGVHSLYKELYPKLRGPNRWEPRGQGLFFVPGLYVSQGKAARCYNR